MFAIEPLEPTLSMALCVGRQVSGAVGWCDGGVTWVSALEVSWAGGIVVWWVGKK